jgi:hypothetical protein
VTIRIESTPSGAEVFRAADGILLGETPFEQRLAAGAGQAAYVVRAEGYRAERVRLPVERDGVARVTLVKTRARDKAPKPPPSEVPGPKPRTKDGALDPFGD